MSVLSLKSLVDQMAETVGDAIARQAVDTAIKQLGWQKREEFDQAQTVQVLTIIAKQEDVTGIAARLLRIRAEVAFEKLTTRK